MRKHPKQPGQESEAFVDMDNYFKKSKRSKRLEEKRMHKLLEEIHEAEDYVDDDFDQDLELFKRDHHIGGDD